MAATEGLARFLVNTSYDHLPPEAVEAAHRAVLDTLGVALAGSREQAGRLVEALAAEASGTPEAAVWGRPLRLPAAEAALVNGVFAHALDFDDVNDSMRGHPSAPLLPAVLALAEKLGAGGRQVIEAFVLGFEVECKLGRAMGRSHYERGWHATATLGTLGAAAACAPLLRLGEMATRMALGLATSMASGSRQNFGTMTKPFHAGQAARTGLLAALLAGRGFTADADILEAPLGFGSLFAPDGDWSPEEAVARLGDPWEIVSPGVSVKRYPCCFATHRALDGLLELRGRHGLRADAVERVEVVMPRGAALPLIYSRPRMGLEGKFSLEYCLAAALLDGGVGTASFVDTAVERPEAQALLRRVFSCEGPGEATAVVDGYAEVTVITDDGSRFEVRVDHPRGSPQAPLSWEELVGKFRDCAALALPAAAVERVVTLVEHLEELADVGELTAALTAAEVPATSRR